MAQGDTGCGGGAHGGSQPYWNHGCQRQDTFSMTDDTNSHSDLQFIEQLRGWLAAKMSAGPDLQISNVVEPSQGFSSRTILFKVAWSEQGVTRERELVARIQRDTVCP